MKTTDIEWNNRKQLKQSERNTRNAKIETGLESLRSGNGNRSHSVANRNGNSSEQKWEN